MVYATFNSGFTHVRRASASAAEENMMQDRSLVWRVFAALTLCWGFLGGLAGPTALVTAMVPVPAAAQQSLQGLDDIKTAAVSYADSLGNTMIIIIRSIFVIVLIALAVHAGSTGRWDWMKIGGIFFAFVAACFAKKIINGIASVAGVA